MSRALFALVLIGCGASPAPAPVAVVELVQTNGPPPAPLPAHTLWAGRYECAQGVTGLALTLDLEPGGRATAVFDFGPVSENPTVPSGRYLVMGTLDDSGQLVLSPDRWIAQPAGYVMVGLRAAIDPRGRTMQGRIENPSCTVLALQRVQ